MTDLRVRCLVLTFLRVTLCARCGRASSRYEAAARARTLDTNAHAQSTPRSGRGERRNLDGCWWLVLTVVPLAPVSPCEPSQGPADQVTPVYRVQPGHGPPASYKDTSGPSYHRYHHAARTAARGEFLDLNFWES